MRWVYLPGAHVQQGLSALLLVEESFAYAFYLTFHIRTRQICISFCVSWSVTILTPIEAPFVV